MQKLSKRRRRRRRRPIESSRLASKERRAERPMRTMQRAGYQLDGLFVCLSVGRRRSPRSAACWRRRVCFLFSSSSSSSPAPRVLLLRAPTLVRALGQLSGCAMVSPTVAGLLAAPVVRRHPTGLAKIKLNKAQFYFNRSRSAERKQRLAQLERAAVRFFAIQIGQFVNRRPALSSAARAHTKCLPPAPI